MTCISAHEETPRSNDTIDSVLRHWEVGWAKDLSAPPHSYYFSITIAHYFFSYINSY